MRKIISAFKISVDGYIEDPEEKQDWVENWEDDYGLTEIVDLCILGRVMYSGYEEYWTAALDAKAKLPTGKLPTPKEVEYAKWANKTPHIMISRKSPKVNWKHTQVVSDLEEIRKLKNNPGKDIYLIGGAKLVSSMINAGLVDEIRLLTYPVILGGGKALFADVTERHHLKLVSTKQIDSDKVYTIYNVQSNEKYKK